MKKCFSRIWLPLLLLCGAAQAQDGFEGVRCGSDIPKALVGKRLSDEPAVKIEARHKELTLKSLGGDEISDHLSSSSWSICGSEFMLLIDAHDVVKDALLFPPHSRTSPEFGAGTCQASGKPVAGLLVALLNNQAADNSSRYSTDDETLLPAVSAWKINEKTGKFSAFPAAGLSCPRNGIITTDGGP